MCYNPLISYFDAEIHKYFQYGGLKKGPFFKCQKTKTALNVKEIAKKANKFAFDFLSFKRSQMSREKT